MPHRTVAELMTRDVATASPEASLKTVARSLDYNGVSALPVVDTRHHPSPHGPSGVGHRRDGPYLHERGIKRLPVVDETGTLVGIVSRTDLPRDFDPERAPDVR